MHSSFVCAPQHMPCSILRSRSRYRLKHSVGRCSHCAACRFFSTDTSVVACLLTCTVPDFQLFVLMNSDSAGGWEANQKRAESSIKQHIIYRGKIIKCNVNPTILYRLLFMLFNVSYCCTELWQVSLWVCWGNSDITLSSFNACFYSSVLHAATLLLQLCAPSARLFHKNSHRLIFRAHDPVLSCWAHNRLLVNQWGAHCASSALRKL